MVVARVKTFGLFLAGCMRSLLTLTGVGGGYMHERLTFGDSRRRQLVVCLFPVHACDLHGIFLCVMVVCVGGDCG